MCCRNTAAPAGSRRPGGGIPPRRPRPEDACDPHGVQPHPPRYAGARRWRAGVDGGEASTGTGMARAPRHVGVRRPEVSRRFQAFRLRQSERAQGRPVLAAGADGGLQPELPHLQFAQHLHPQGRCRAGHGGDLCDANGRRRRRAGFALRACRARGAHRARRAHLSVPDAVRHLLPRRQPHHRPRRRLLAQHPEREGASDHPAAHARRRLHGGARRRHRSRQVCAQARARDVPLVVAGLPIFSRAYYSTKPFDETTLEPPLGSGPYMVGRFEPGRFIEYDRVKDWWGANLPVSVGQNNFDVVRYEFYRDREVAFEGFTSKTYLFREEFTSRIWATRYDFPAIREGRVKRDVLQDDTPSGAQGWFFNTRREKLKDRRLREAMIYAFDFEWTNKNLMYDSYKRTHSV